jgi:23S rRNA (cytidine1920-2'-O)/16S rRNA (cytidine1409-2'-O)-methyltransferase
VAGSRRAATGGSASRLDQLLVSRGLAETRARAQALILAGNVRVGGEVVTRAGVRVGPEEEVQVEGGSRFVSRAGEKLAGALDVFEVEVAGRDCLDAGASTGGFTDVLLDRGASRVISVDVGYGQLDWSLRNDPRVTVMERTNVRHLSGEDLPFEPDLLVADLSFISLPVALENLLRTAPSIGEAVLLVKPQFEAGPDLVERGGVVRDVEVHAEVILKVAEEFGRIGFGAVDVTRASVAGKKSGNHEYPLWFSRGRERTLGEERVREVVRDG